jgi:3',5'-cyclic AMP phosphodiesterase CpdA
MSTRARVAALSAAAALLSLLPVAARGLRIPPPQWGPGEPPAQGRDAGGGSARAEGAVFLGEENGVLVFRACVPEPRLTLASRRSPLRVRLENVHARATSSLAAERVAPTTLLYECTAEAPLAAQISLPHQQRWRAVALGDTGAEFALEWFLARAAELQADFALHLGDLAYTEDGIARAARALRSAPLPVYTTIGNHDFHAGTRLLHEGFARSIGPLNSFFAAGGVRFLNLDTAADSWPAGAGARGRTLARFHAQGGSGPVVVFTHRPLVDPRPEVVAAGESHGVNRGSESAWLRARMREIGADLLLHGHIHTHLEHELDGIPVRIAGGGLGLTLGGAPDPDARLVVLEWEEDAPESIEVSWEPLNLPQ